MRIAIVGFGTAGEGRLHAYRPIAGAEVVAVTDPSPGRRERARTIAPGVATFPGLGELLAAVAVDVVDICTPPAYHVDLERAGLEAGLHVICEKPVAVHTSEALELVDLARRQGRLLYPAHNYAFSPMMAVLAAAAGDGRIGSPMTASFRIARDSHARGVAGWQPDWRRDPSMARGGILLDHGTHCAYMMTRLFGQEPRTVSCTAQWAGDDPAAGMDLAVRARLEFAVGTAEIDLSWMSDRRANRYEITGPAGTAVVEDGVAQVRSGLGVQHYDLISPTRGQTHQEWFAGMYADFAMLVATGAGWERPLAEIVSTTALIAAAYRSAALGGEPVRPADLPVPEAR